MKIFILDSFHTKNIQNFITNHFPSHEVSLTANDAEVAIISGKIIVQNEVNISKHCKVVAISTMPKLLEKIRHKVDATFEKNRLFRYFEKEAGPLPQDLRDDFERAISVSTS